MVGVASWSASWSIVFLIFVFGGWHGIRDNTTISRNCVVGYKFMGRVFTFGNGQRGIVFQWGVGLYLTWFATIMTCARTARVF